MDPLSIATAAGATIKVLYQVLEKTFNFVKDAKVIDQTLSVIRADLSSLVVVLETVRSTLRKPQQLVLAQADANNVFPSIVQAAIQECHDTAGSIHDILKGIEEGNNSKSLVARSVRQVRFLNRKDDLRKIQGRLKAQKANLQLLLQMLNVSIAQYPTKVFQENIGPQINLLESLVRKALLQDGAPQDKPNAASQIEKSADFDDSLALTGVDHITSKSESYPPAEGDSLSTGHGPSPKEMPFVDGRGFEDTTGRDMPIPDLDDGPDSDDELELEHTLSAFYKGQDLYQKTYYRDSEKVLRSCLKTAAGIRSGGINSGTIKAIQLKLALSCFYQEKWEDAGEILHHLTTVEALTKTDILLQSDAFLALAKVYLAGADYDAATLAFREAKAGYKKLRGKTDPDYIESSRLLILVYTLSGDYVAAQIYNKALPTQSQLQVRLLVPGIKILDEIGKNDYRSPKDHPWLYERCKTLLLISKGGFLDPTCIDILHMIGVNVNNRFLDEKEHKTPLMEAASKGFVPTIERLIRVGADIQIKDSEGRTALDFAVENNHLYSKLLLLGVDMDEIEGPLRRKPFTQWSHFLWAINKGNGAVIDYFLDRGDWVSTNAHDLLDRGLGIAVSKGQFATVEKLLTSAAANPNALAAIDEEGYTVLMDAASRHFVYITDLLLKKGADVSIKNYAGETALDVALRTSDLSEDSQQIVFLLRNPPSNPTVVSSKGRKETVENQEMTL